MKAKSTKLRMLITLRTLFKHSDRNHRISSTKLNEYLRPYGLECSRRVLVDTISAIRDFGIDVQSLGTWKQRGVWLGSRPISDDMLRRLVFAISTNPYLTQPQIRECLDSLRPVMTVYQEAELLDMVEIHEASEANEGFSNVYFEVFDAIRQKQRISYTTSGIKFDKELGKVCLRERRKTRFTPKYLYRVGSSVYMVGYNHSDKCVHAVDLSDIVSLYPAVQQKDPSTDEVEKILRDIAPSDYVPQRGSPVIYQGPVVFVCRGQHLRELVDRYGMPDEPLRKNHNGHTTFILHQAKILPDTLIWLSQIPGHGIRIKGPTALVEGIKRYNAREIGALLEPRLDKKAP